MKFHCELGKDSVVRTLDGGQLNCTPVKLLVVTIVPLEVGIWLAFVLGTVILAGSALCCDEEV